MFKNALFAAFISLSFACLAGAATVDINTSPAGKKQIIDGFGAHQGDSATSQAWWQDLFFDDMLCSIYRIDLTPRFIGPYSYPDGTYNSPWFHNNPALPGPEGNNCRTYTDANSYTHTTAIWGRETPIAVMGPDINNNVSYFNYSDTSDGLVAQLGEAKKGQLGDFKLVGSLWSPAPWVKLSSGHAYNDPYWWPGPYTGTPWPFIWAGNFAGGKLDVSDTPLEIFNDGTGPTSALAQYARCTAAYIRGFQNTFGVKFYAVSIQNELNFEEYYNSCTYQLSSQYIAALKAVRAEFDKYPDLNSIMIEGPEDLIGTDVWGMWQVGSDITHKNLQYLKNIGADPNASAALAFFSIHGYASNGVSSAGANPTQWNWWANGWTTPPAGGIPSPVHGFTWYGKKSWMTETSSENPAWKYPTSGYPNNGGWSIALKIHQALTVGMESAWLYWTFAPASDAVDEYHLTDHTLKQNSPKYVAAKHFFRFIRPGSYRYNTTVTGDPNLLASSYVNDADGTLTIVLVNCNATASSADINVPAYPADINLFDCYTSSNGSYWQSSRVHVNGGQATVSVPGYGVVTLYGPSVCTRCNFSDDDAVNFLDFATIANQWRSAPGSPSADIVPPPDGDGVVDMRDFDVFADCWLKN